MQGHMMLGAEIWDFDLSYNMADGSFVVNSVASNVPGAAGADLGSIISGTGSAADAGGINLADSGFGVIKSEETVATRIRPSSSGKTPESARAALAAFTASVRVVSVSEDTRCRSRMPVRLFIHSSLVSIMVERYSFVTHLSGRQLPVPIIFALITHPCLISLTIKIITCLLYPQKEDLSMGTFLPMPMPIQQGQACCLFGEKQEIMV